VFKNNTGSCQPLSFTARNFTFRVPDRNLMRYSHYFFFILCHLIVHPKAWFTNPECQRWTVTKAIGHLLVAFEDAIVS
jgi:hypothetical protein